MTLGAIALAVTIGSIIGMAAVLCDLWRAHTNQTRRYRKYVNHIRSVNNALQWENLKLRRKLARLDRVRDDRGRFVKKGGV